MLSKTHYFYTLAKEIDKTLTDEQIDEIHCLIWDFHGSPSNKSKKILEKLITKYAKEIRRLDKNEKNINE